MNSTNTSFTRAFLCLALALALCHDVRAQPAPAPGKKTDLNSWVGQNVLPAKPWTDIKLRDLDDPKISYPFSHAFPIVVLDEREDSLRIHDGRHEGWVSRADFVLTRDAPAYFDSILQNDPTATWALLMRGVAWLGKHQYDNAIRDCNAVIAANPTVSGAFHNRGAAFMGKGNFAQAYRDLTEAIRLNPNSSSAISLRGAVLYFQGEYDKAIADCNRAIEIAPRNAHAFTVRGDTWQAKKEYNKAMQDLDQALRLNPKRAEIWYDKACCHAVQRQTDAAIETLRKALELGYDDFAHMAKDSDLDSIRKDPRYKELVKKHVR